MNTENKKSVCPYCRQPIEGADVESCRFNRGVECSERNCGACGWNPNVNKKRVDALRAGSKRSCFTYSANYERKIEE